MEQEVFKVTYNLAKKLSNVEYRLKNRNLYIFFRVGQILTLFSHFISCSTTLAGRFGNTEYQHQDSGITNTQLTWLLLNNCSMSYEMDTSTFYTLSRYSGHKLHYIEVGQRGREIQWMGFRIWNKCGVMIRTWHKKLST
jgi:hypothetical protein